MKILYLVPILLMGSGSFKVAAQSCTPLGDQTTYGSNDTWIGYVYDDMNFTAYQGYVSEGTAGNPAFNQGFGGSNASYATNGCTINTETFCVRYKLRKTFTSGSYEFTAGGDDGYRLSIDGGVTWIIDRWFDQGYNTSSSINFLNGTYDLVLEFYENGGGNQISFQLQTSCSGTGDPSAYGTGDIWQGYIYDGMNFSVYLGDVTAGTTGDSNFDENFGGGNVMFNTNTCATQTETFSARYRLRKTFQNGTYSFLLGGDDGFRFSIDGGITWVIDRWWDQSFNIIAYTGILNGTYDLVIEYYENGGDNRISFNMNGAVLPVQLLYLRANSDRQGTQLKWEIAAGNNLDFFEIERSANGGYFQTTGKVERNGNANQIFNYTDNEHLPGTSYYRLKIFDLDGNHSYSQIIIIKNHLPEGIKIFPTLVQNGTVSIRSEKSLHAVSILIFDLSGKKLSDRYYRTIAAGQTISTTLAKNTSPGTYFIKVKTRDGSEIKKLSVIR